MELRVGDVADEVLLEERPGALALVLPMAELELRHPCGLLRGSRVVEVELAVRAVLIARVRRVGAEERLDEAGARRAVGACRARRLRVEARRLHRPDEVPLELSFDPGNDRLPVLPGGVARSRALTGERREMPAVLAEQRERPVAVVLHGVGSRLHVVRPFVPAR